MTDNFLEQLARKRIPPVPKLFEQQVHRQVNHWLLVFHVLDFSLRTLPYAAMEFTRATIGLIAYSLKGRFASPQKDSLKA